VEEIANAFLSNREAIKKRLLRARENLRTGKLVLENLQPAEIEARYDNVLTVLYLLFSEGYFSKSNKSIIRKELCAEAIRLTLVLTENPLTDKARTNALLALTLVIAGRFSEALQPAQRAYDAAPDTVMSQLALGRALAETGDKAEDFGKYFDTISICLSKGLGAPVGSVLLYKKEYETKARRMRKALGGGMRQAGFLAAAALYALDHHVHRLREDHARARTIGRALAEASWVKSVMPVDSNIVLFAVADGLTPEQVMKQFAAHQVKALIFSATEIRLVTHLDFTDAMLDQFVAIVKKITF